MIKFAMWLKIRHSSRPWPRQLNSRMTKALMESASRPWTHYPWFKSTAFTNEIDGKVSRLSSLFTSSACISATDFFSWPVADDCVFMQLVSLVDNLVSSLTSKPSIEGASSASHSGGSTVSSSHSHGSDSNTSNVNVRFSSSGSYNGSVDSGYSSSGSICGVIVHMDTGSNIGSDGSSSGIESVSIASSTNASTDDSA